jgi:hypothetical protein
MALSGTGIVSFPVQTPQKQPPKKNLGNDPRILTRTTYVGSPNLTSAANPRN